MKQVWRPNFPTTPEFWPKINYIIGFVNREEVDCRVASRAWKCRMFCQKWEWWQWALMNHFLCTESWVAKLRFYLFVRKSVSYFKRYFVQFYRVVRYFCLFWFPILIKLGHVFILSYCFFSRSYGRSH